MLAPDITDYNTYRSSRVLHACLGQRMSDARLAVGVLLPSGKVRVGWLPEARETSSDREYERGCVKPEIDYADLTNERGRAYTASFYRDRDPLPLGLSAVPNYHKELEPRKRHGLRGITANGRETVKECAYLLERQHGRRLGFYTLTCPFTDEESIYSYNQNIAYIQRLYFQKVKRLYETKGLSFQYVSVLEIQPERYRNTGVPVLHIHYISPCYFPGTYSWILTSTEIRHLWWDACSVIAGSCPLSGAAIDATVVRKSAIGYIGKYLSKSGAEVAAVAEYAPDQLPSQWWSSSRELRKAVARYSAQLPTQISQDMMSGAAFDPSHPAYLQYHQFVYVQWQGREICVGLSGQMSAKVVHHYQSLPLKIPELRQVLATPLITFGQ